jgi:hypothetical protein
MMHFFDACLHMGKSILTSKTLLQIKVLQMETHGTGYALNKVTTQ